MKLKTLTLSLLLGLAATSAFAEAQYQVRIPANVNLAAPEAPQPPAEPISLALSAEAPPVGMVGQPYSFNLLDRLTITGGSGSHNYSDTTWSLKDGDALPPGLSLSGSLISGTPTVKNEAGTSFEVTGTYRDASGKQVYTIIVEGQKFLAKALSPGGGFTCAITLSDTVKCWGSNHSGQLGNGTKTNSIQPVSVANLAGVVQISSGANHACAVLSSREIYCWGNNNEGKLGNNSRIEATVPVKTLNISNAIRVSAGSQHTCALEAGGSVKCWGQEHNGKLGNYSTTGLQLVPVSVPDLPSGVTHLEADTFNTCAVQNGAAKCWGSNYYGQLGNNSVTNSAYPVQVSGLSSGVIGIDVGQAHACALQSTGQVLCWGEGAYGKLGTTVPTNSKVIMSGAPWPASLVPVQVNTLDSGVTAIGVGGSSSCAIQDGVAKCWGYGGNGTLGNGDTQNIVTPTSTGSMNASVTTLYPSISGHYCAKTTDRFWCWGSNSTGELGDRTSTNRLLPVEVLP